MSDEGLNFTFTWNALSDACPKCRQLNGKEYHNPDVYRETVYDPIWGDVWNFDTGSLAHPNCRCQLATRVEVDTETLFGELKRVLLQLRDKLLNVKQGLKSG